MELEPARIRPYRPDDLDDLYRVCLQTADNGGDATALFEDPRLPGHLYAAPYAIFEPSLAFVAEDLAGVGGYIVAALDSSAFARRLESDWWPAMRTRYPEPAPGQALSPPERQAISHIHHPWGTHETLAERYPSHLHIDLVPRLQGRGLGRQLMATLKSALRDHGSPGLHLLCGRSNQRAAAFYRHLGFTELPATDVHIFAMELGNRPG